MALQAAEVWVTDSANLVVTVPYDEHEQQSETEMRERFFRAVTHRFHEANKDLRNGYLRSAQLADLQIIEDPDFHPRPQYGVVLAHHGVRA